jgi:hypothetical protein
VFGESQRLFKKILHELLHLSIALYAYIRKSFKLTIKNRSFVKIFLSFQSLCFSKESTAINCTKKSKNRWRVIRVRTNIWGLNARSATCTFFSRGSVEFEMLRKRTFTTSPNNTTQNDDLIIRQDKHRSQQPR